MLAAFGHNLVWGLPATIVIIVVALLAVGVRYGRGEIRRRKPPD
jgi:VIT1/CCC1 family predicted Fe2+/Mn2+ transporter